jgi:hypothetical protein
MRKFVARQNIKRFRGRLATEADPAKREVLLKLIAEEEEKLRIGTDEGPDDEASA